MKDDFLFEVIHDKKGEGKAISLSKKDGVTYIKIAFGDVTEDFVYPDQFFFHLKAKDPQIQKKIIKEYAESQDKSNPKNPKYHLSIGFLAGTNAQDLYGKYCKLFDWNPLYLGCFSKQQKLYAKNVTPEKFAVWMPVHTNLCEEYNKEHSWFNFIMGSRIKEVWFDEDYELLNDNSTRVCFARTKKGYEFQGIYVPEETKKEEIKGKLELVRTYKRISTRYPIEAHTHVDQPSVPVPRSNVNEYVETTLVIEGCKMEVCDLEENRKGTVYLDKIMPMYQNRLLGKKTGDTYSLAGKTYRIHRIWIKP